MRRPGPGTCLLLSVLLLAALAPAGAQSFRHAWDPRTGDAWVDTWLDDMNRYGAAYPDAFIDEIVRYHDAPHDLVRELLVERRWAPGDVYYACSLASVTGRPCRHVADLWERDHAQGWGVIAQNLGVEPGSAQFQRLKKGFVPSYDRWARPILVDEQLARDYPDRKRSPPTVAKDTADGQPGEEPGNSRAGKPEKPDKGKGKGGDKR